MRIGHDRIRSRRRAGPLLAAAAMLVGATLQAGHAGAQPTTYAEAPILAERVAAGTLPPVEDRLPTEPLVLEPYEEIGDYGGTWDAVLTGSGDRVWLERTMAYDNLVRWDPEWTRVIPNVARAFEVSDDATTFTFHLREGHRWSDGEPFTSADILFFHEVISDPRLYPTPPSWMVSGDQLATVEAPDDHTVRIVFAEPNGLFVQQMATMTGRWLTHFPRHYASQFHIDHNPDGIAALMAEAGVETWVDLFHLRVGSSQNPTGHWRNVDKPRLAAWLQVTPYDGTTTRVLFERNPYYFKVDPEGNQLPYIDSVAFQVVQDREVTLLRAISGEIDFQWRRINNPLQRPVLVEHAEEAGYSFHERRPSLMNAAVFYLNLTHRDPVQREVYQNRDFRIGLSHAIDRQELIDAVLIGQGEPWQAAPRRESPFYDEAFATQYTEHDVDLANQYLDRAGYTDRDGDGFRLRPDGERIVIVAEMAGGKGFEDYAVLMQRHLREVGIDFQFRVIERSLYETRRSGNDLDAGFWEGEAGMEVFLDPRYYFPYNYESDFAVGWAYWYEGRPEGIEPPEAAQQQMALYDQIRVTGDPEEQARLMHELLAIAREQFWLMGISLPPTQLGITRHGMRNTPSGFPGSVVYPDPAPTNPPQYFFEGGQD